jgi:UDP-N-acetylglucosamine 4,6-dehydratase
MQIWEDKFLNPELHEKCKVIFNDASVLVTGGTGSFGQTFIRTLLKHYEPRRVIVFSRDELKQSVMQKEFSTKKYPCMRYFLGDVRDPQRLSRAFKGVDIIIHAAALKQVPALEYNPTEAIKTNVIGAMNIIEAAIDCDVGKIVALSTDKAAMPINLYGASKLCSDKLFVAGNMAAGSARTRFAVVRYGNVFGSRGSIVPVIHHLRQQPEKMIGLTDVRMTRFNITLMQAVNFVLSGLVTMNGGEIFIPKLPSYKLPQVAEAVAPECATKVIGRRPGEKVHELMIPEDEAYRTKEIADRYIIEPEWESFGGSYTSLPDTKPVAENFYYNSGENDDWCTVEEMKDQYRDWCAKYGYEYVE